MWIAAIALFAAGQGLETTARDAPERSADSRDKVICKRFNKTGSLVSVYRTCKPKSEWDRERDNIRQLGVSDACRLRGDGLGC
jgi:hypothetical protein